MDTGYCHSCTPSNTSSSILHWASHGSWLSESSSWFLLRVATVITIHSIGVMSRTVGTAIRFKRSRLSASWVRASGLRVSCLESLLSSGREGRGRRRLRVRQVVEGARLDEGIKSDIAIHTVDSCSISVMLSFEGCLLNGHLYLCPVILSIYDEAWVLRNLSWSPKVASICDGTPVLLLI